MQTALIYMPVCVDLHSAVYRPCNLKMPISGNSLTVCDGTRSHFKALEPSFQTISPTSVSSYKHQRVKIKNFLIKVRLFLNYLQEFFILKNFLKNSKNIFKNVKNYRMI